MYCMFYVKKQLQMVLNKQTSFNFIKDDLANLQLDGIVNLSIYTEIDIFELKSTVISFLENAKEKLAK